MMQAMIWAAVVAFCGAMVLARPRMGRVRQGAVAVLLGFVGLDVVILLLVAAAWLGANS